MHPTCYSTIHWCGEISNLHDSVLHNKFIVYAICATERSKIPSRWRCLLVEFRAFASLLGFLFVLETAFGFLEAHAGMHLKEVFEVVRHSVTFGEALFFGNISTERRR